VCGRVAGIRETVCATNSFSTRTRDTANTRSRTHDGRRRRHAHSRQRHCLRCRCCGTLCMNTQSECACALSNTCAQSVQCTHYARWCCSIQARPWLAARPVAHTAHHRTPCMRKHAHAHTIVPHTTPVTPRTPSSHTTFRRNPNLPTTLRTAPFAPPDSSRATLRCGV
jgi:hypothetical protein